jgi:hypothetical protein
MKCMESGFLNDKQFTFSFTCAFFQVLCMDIARILVNNQHAHEPLVIYI